MTARTSEGEGAMVRVAIGFTDWAERWFPDAFIFVAIAVVIVALDVYKRQRSRRSTSAPSGPEASTTWTTSGRTPGSDTPPSGSTTVGWGL